MEKVRQSVHAATNQLDAPVKKGTTHKYPALDDLDPVVGPARPQEEPMDPEDQRALEKYQKKSEAKRTDCSPR